MSLKHKKITNLQREIKSRQSLPLMSAATTSATNWHHQGTVLLTNSSISMSRWTRIFPNNDLKIHLHNVKYLSHELNTH